MFKGILSKEEIIITNEKEKRNFYERLISLNIYHIVKEIKPSYTPPDEKVKREVKDMLFSNLIVFDEHYYIISHDLCNEIIDFVYPIIKSQAHEKVEQEFEKTSIEYDFHSDPAYKRKMLEKDFVYSRDKIMDSDPFEDIYKSMLFDNLFIAKRLNNYRDFNDKLTHHLFEKDNDALIQSYLTGDEIPYTVFFKNIYEFEYNYCKCSKILKYLAEIDDEKIISANRNVVASNTLWIKTFEEMGIWEFLRDKGYTNLYLSKIIFVKCYKA